MSAEQKNRFSDYIEYFQGSLHYDTYYPYYIDESTSSVTLYMEANDYPDCTTPVEEWNRNGTYTTQILDIPYLSENTWKPVRIVIKIQKWIHKTSHQRVNSPVFHLDKSHNATERVIQSLKKDIKIRKTSEIREKYGVTDSFISSLMKEITKKDTMNLKYLKDPSLVETIYIGKCFFGDTPMFIMVWIDQNEQACSLIEWERTATKLLEKMNRYLAIKAVYVDDDISSKLLNMLSQQSMVSAFDILGISQDKSNNNLKERKKLNWRHLKRLDEDSKINLQLLKSRMENNQLKGAKKGFYRTIFYVQNEK